MNTKKFALAALCLVFLASGIISASDKSVYKTKPGGTYQASQVKRRIKEINRLKTELKTAKKIDDVGNLIKKVNKLANELKTNYNSEKKAIETFDTFVNNSVELVPEKLKIKATTNAFYLFTLKTRALRPQIRNFGKKEDIKQLKIAMKNIKKLKIIIDEELNKNVLKKIIEQRKLIAKKDVKWDKDEFEKDWQEKKDEDVDQFIIAKTDISKIEISKKNEIKTFKQIKNEPTKLAKIKTAVLDKMQIVPDVSNLNLQYILITKYIEQIKDQKIKNKATSFVNSAYDEKVKTFIKNLEKSIELILQFKEFAPTNKVQANENLKDVKDINNNYQLDQTLPDSKYGKEAKQIDTLFNAEKTSVIKDLNEMILLLKFEKELKEMEEEEEEEFKIEELEEEKFEIGKELQFEFGKEEEEIEELTPEKKEEEEEEEKIIKLTPKKEAKQTKKEITMVEKATSLVKKFKQELDTAEEHNNTLVKLAAPTTKTDNLEPILDINQLFLHTKELYKTAHKTFNKSKNNKTVIIKSFEQRDKSFKFPKIQNVSYLNENTWKIALKLATTNNTSYKAIVTRALKETKEITAVINLAIKSPIGITYNNEIYDYTVSEFTKFKKNNKAILNIGLKDVNTGKTGTKEGGIIFAEKKYEYADVALKKAMKTAEELHFIKSDF